MGWFSCWFPFKTTNKKVPHNKTRLRLPRGKKLTLRMGAGGPDLRCCQATGAHAHGGRLRVASWDRRGFARTCFQLGRVSLDNQLIEKRQARFFKPWGGWHPLVAHVAGCFWESVHCFVRSMDVPLGLGLKLHAPLGCAAVPSVSPALVPI